ncbi:rod shape-determining protein MreC [Acidovorax sp. 62]|uniref:rod shape-determining protein MreC n=1 Tax=unclassified Acidovorax TaxID=2684926 RepID=UPI000C16F442|nr:MULTISPECIES: rod shape-determining protein MreC [unclassified Acidovorax]PIF28439.1 rod shape-determining protein MreC [Acidovorax sp. 56]PIF92976.1 rod shape-determining protein MreC [Acidovorax sp. 62]
MPLGTLDRSAPPFFKQGPSALSRLAAFSALALFLMVADARFQITGPVRLAIGSVLYPVQWLVFQPVELARHGSGYFQSLQSAQADADAAAQKLVLVSQQAHQAEQLAQENVRLRKLLALRERLQTPAQAAQVIYDTADPYTRRVVIDQGQLHGVEQGVPVMDEGGVLGQVTRVFPLVSEVTLLVDRDQAIPVLNLRTGARAVAYGDPMAEHGGGIELRFIQANADVREDDLLTTSGVDGVYPPGLPVARVTHVERRADSAFARIYCKPLAQVQGVRHVMVLKPLTDHLPPRPEPAPTVTSKRVRK